MEAHKSGCERVFSSCPGHGTVAQSFGQVSSQSDELFMSAVLENEYRQKYERFCKKGEERVQGIIFRIYFYSR